MATTGARPESPLIVIVGPTASGKTSLAIRLAEKHGGEIICADSRTVYRGMDIGTAKPTAQEQARVPHWGLDLAEPSEIFTAADFKQYAVGKIEEIRKRGHIPFLVGGTGLYVDAVIFDYQFGPRADIRVRQELDSLSIDELQRYCKNNNIILPKNHKNKRHLIRAIELKNVTTSRNKEPLSTSIIVGTATDRDVLRARIEARAEQLFDDGVVEEATLLGKKYGWHSQAMTGNIYPLVRQHIIGELSVAEMKKKFVTLDWRLAKRQLTWLKRNGFIQWLPLDEAEQYLDTLLVRE